MQFRTSSPGDEDEVGRASLPEISCASAFVSRTRDQSEGERGYEGYGREEEGLSSSSWVLTTVESLEGRRESVFPSPVI